MMKRMNLWASVSLLIVLFFVSSQAFCQDIKGRWGVGYRYGYVTPDDADFKSHGNGHYLSLTNGLTENLAIKYEGGYFRLKSQAGSEIGVYSLLANLQLRANLNKLTPYVFAGLGFHGYRYDNLGRDDRKDRNWSVAYVSGAGAEYFLTKNWALNLEAGYLYGNTGGDATLDVYGWQYGGGIKYYF